MDYGPYLLVGMVVFGSMLGVFVGFILHCELRARKRVDPLDEHFKSLDLPPKIPGGWF